MKTYKAFKIENVEDVASIYTDKNKTNFPFFDDNGEESGGNSYLLLSSDIDCEVTRKFLIETCKLIDVLVFDNLEDATIQAADGGLTTYITSANKYIVAV